MEEEVTEVDEIVVIGRVPGSNNVAVQVTFSSGDSTTFQVRQDVVDDYISQTGGSTEPNSPERLEEVSVFIVTELLKYLRNNLPGLSPQELAELDTVISTFEAAARAYQLGQLTREDFRGAVQEGLEFFFGEVGDYLGSVVAGSIVGAAAAVGFSPTSVGGLAAGAAGIAIGAAISQAFPGDALAAGLTGVIFGSADAIHSLERGFQEQLQDRFFEFYQGMMDYIFRNFPEGTPRPYAERGFTVGDELDGVVVYAGTNGLDNISFADATGAIAIDMSIDGQQDTGGGGTVRLLTIDGVFGSRFNDTLLGNDFNNVLAGAGGDDFIDGRGGFDYADYRLAVAGVTVDLRLSVQQTSGAGTDTLIGIEGVIGSQHGDVLTGDDGANTLYGLEGSDVLNGGAGNDLLIGGANRDGEYDVLNGGDGFDTVSYEHETRDLFVQLGDGGQFFVAEDGLSLIGGDLLTSIEAVMLGRGDDRAAGDASNNRIFGNDGNDLLSGGDGDDLIEGGRGNDTLTGGAGFDTLSYALAASGVTINLQTVQPDWYWAGWANVADGDGGVDQVLDHFEGLLGSMHDDFLVGNFLNNDVRGAAGDDRLEGMAGDDRLFGGEGADTLVGGAGADRFMFESIDGWADGATDVILDFELGVDSLVFSGMGITAAQLTISQSGTTALLGVDADSDGVVDATIQLNGVGGAFGFQNVVFE